MSIISYIKLYFGDKYYRMKNFGILYLIDFTLCSIGRKLGLPMRFFGANEVDYRYVKRRYGKWKSFAKYQSSYSEGNTIWVMWWQGADIEKPSLIEACIESISRNKGDYNLVLIDKNNYRDYIGIPEFILDKYNNGIIGIAAFSDYIRFALMESYGGWYLDATIYVTRTIVKPVASFYSVKYDGLKNTICKSMWSPFLWYLPQGHPLTIFIHKAFDDYWLHHDKIVNYFLIDALVRTFYHISPDFKAQIDSLGYDNPDLYFLQSEEGRMPYDEEVWQEKLKRNQFFKCNRKEPITDGSSFAGKILGTKWFMERRY